MLLYNDALYCREYCQLQLVMEGNCLQLALEGERLCKSGDCIHGVQFFEAAVKTGQDTFISFLSVSFPFLS